MAGVDEWGALLPGSRIAGYEIKRKLGQGGFGIAYEGYNADLKARAAIKEFFPRDMVARSGTNVSVREGESKGFYERFLNRFVDEARAVHHLDHPNIVKVRHFERANNTAYVVMDYVDGQNLKAWLEPRRGKLAEQDLRAVFAPVMDALEYVHAQNMLHRDVSPLNIMVDQKGKPWLIDFGAFKEMWQEQPRRTSLLAANPAYAPPEQSDAGAGQDHGPFTDIFALCATMYEAIAGRKPASAVSRMAQMSFGRPDPLAPLQREAQTTCRPEVYGAVMSGLSIRPEARPQTVAELASELGWTRPVRTEVSAPRMPTVASRIDESTRPYQPAPSTAPSPRPPLQSLSSAPVAAPEPRRRRLGLGAGLAVLGVGAALLAAVLFYMRPGAVLTTKPVQETNNVPPSSQRSPTLPRPPATATTPTPPQVPVSTSPPLDRILTAAEERSLKPKDEFQECAVCPRMVVVPAGKFLMGSPADEQDRFDNEGPVHDVTIPKPFAVGKFTVTFAEWDACVADGGCQSNKAPNDLGWGRDKHPVINVSWDDAKEYVAWLSKKTGKGYRLLTEAEWEYAARAGTSTPFWWGTSISTEQANYDGNFTYGGGVKGEYRKQTVRVDSFQPNPWGLYQVHGNVWQWVEDCWVDTYNGAPNDGSARTTGDCSRRVLRGGSWGYYPWYLRSALRDRYSTDLRYFNFGLRLGRTLTP